MLHDLVTSFRRAVRSPLFSLTLVGILGIGIGATATMVSVLDTLLWRPVAMPQRNELVAITTVLPDGARRGLPLASAESVTRAALPVDAWCAYSGGGGFATQIDGRLTLAASALMSADCVDVMRVAPVMGRWFTDTEAPVTGRGQALAVITDRYWKRMFHGAPDVLGQAVGLNEGTVTVIGAGVMEYVSPHFFSTVGIPVLRGRDVAWTDLPDTTKVALVSESLARDLDVNGDVVGRSIDFGPNAQRQHFQIIGIVGNISLGNYRQNAVKVVFVPGLQANQATYPTFHLRTSGDPLALVGPVTEIVQAASREFVQRAAHVDDMFSNGFIRERIAAVVSIGAATLGVMLAALGLYALLTHSVAMRTREIGIRIAVGAAPRSIRALILRHMLVLVLGGVVVGVPAALMGSAVLQSLMFGVSTTDRVTLAVAVAIVVVVGAAASAVPAVRASRVDPVRLLRAE